MDDLSMEIVRDLDGLVRLEGEWWQLWRSLDDASPFQSPAWLIPWIREFAAGNLCCPVIRRNGRLAGLLPMAFESAANRERLILCGSGLSDYLDGLFAQPERLANARLALDAIIEHEPNVETMTFTNLKPHSALLEAKEPAPWRAPEDSHREVCPVLALDAGTALSGLVPKRMMQNLLYARRRADRLHTLAYRRAGPRDANALFEVLASLHEKRWSEKQESGVLADPAVRRFHRTAIPLLMTHGLLRLDVLDVDGSPAAALYSLVAKRRWHYYIGGFDPRFSKLSVGTLIVGDAVERAWKEAFDAFDFLRGAEAYKYQWGAADEQIVTRRLSRNRHA